MELTIAAVKTFGDFRLAAGVSVAGERIGIFGTSGSGKSTLVNMIAGLVRPDRGEISVDGEILFSSEKGIDVPPERRRVGLVFQQSLLFPHLNVRGNLLYGWRR